MTLQGPRLILLAMDEAMTRLALAQPERMHRELGTGAPAFWPGEEQRKLLEAFLPAISLYPSLRGWGPWLISHTSTEQIVGVISSHGAPDHDCSVELSLNIEGAFRSQGLGSEALSLLIQHIFASDRVFRIYMNLPDHNPSAERLLRSSGFEIMPDSPPHKQSWVLNAVD